MRIHIEMSPGTARRLAVVGITFLITGAAVVSHAVPVTFNDGAVLTAAQLNLNFSDLEDRLASLEASGGTPPGTIVAYGGTSAPPGWVLCDGRSYSGLVPEYAALYEAVGIAFGGDAGSFAFNVPDLRGRFLRGVDGQASRDPDASTRMEMNAGGNVGNAVGSVQADAFQGHWHQNFTAVFFAAGTNRATGTNNTDASNNNGVRNPTPDGVHGAPRTSHETRPLNAFVNFIIKL